MAERMTDLWSSLHSTQTLLDRKSRSALQCLTPLWPGFVHHYVLSITNLSIFSAESSEQSWDTGQWTHSFAHPGLHSKGTGRCVNVASAPNTSPHRVMEVGGYQPSLGGEVWDCVVFVPMDKAWSSWQGEMFTYLVNQWWSNTRWRGEPSF